jgi:hypothetical protein
MQWRKERPRKDSGEGGKVVVASGLADDRKLAIARASGQADVQAATVVASLRRAA